MTVLDAHIAHHRHVHSLYERAFADMAPAASLQGQPELHRRDQRATLQSRAMSAGRALGEGWRCGVYCEGDTRGYEEIA